MPSSPSAVKTSFFDTKIEFLKGVGPQKSELLNTELNLHTFGDLIQYYPFRHEDRSRIYKIRELHEDMPFVQFKGRIREFARLGEGPKKRLIAYFSDGTGEIDLVWFSGIEWILKAIKESKEYLVFGKPNAFGQKYSIPHPEMEEFSEEDFAKNGGLMPVYNQTEKLRKRFLDSKAIAKMIRQVVELSAGHIRETLPPEMLAERNLASKEFSMQNIHFPKTLEDLDKARQRLKFEELFYIQLKLLKNKQVRKVEYRGLVFQQVPSVSRFYNDHLPFELTNAQKRVVKEIYGDMKSGKQMNRLLQGDVGSGKTIVAFIIMLMALDNAAQACLMAPTEILADQHFTGLSEFASLLNIKICKLTGSTRTKTRREIHEQLLSGEMQIIVGTHALLEDVVQFKNLGVCVIDEQHRFGVAQRAKLWAKNPEFSPHVLVMTATPIPRTLAMTLYGDLDVSIIDELPPGRKPIRTVHRYDSHRLQVFGFLREEIKKGRQIYMVFPLIEESETRDWKNLLDGYESVTRFYPEYQVSIVHGKMSPYDKDFEMQRFIRRETQIMVATTVIEVGVNVPNASVMVIENAERFGLSQLHQLRGRVGRGADQSYCILMTGHKITTEGKQRIETMVRTNNGFEIADVDLKLRGPGDLAGTQQSGVLDLLIADLAQDGMILQEARQTAEQILATDPGLTLPQHRNIREHIDSLKKSQTNWSRIS
jgi:ATP-dependent DNA helicase RecG